MVTANALVDGFARALSGGSTSDVLEYFLTDDDGVSCLFGSQDGWARGRTQVAEAIDAFVQQHPRPSVSFESVQQHAIGAVSHIISGLVVYRWRNQARACERSSRFNMIVSQRGPSGILHFAEAPVAPLIELQRFYQQIAGEGHPS